MDHLMLRLQAGRVILVSGSAKQEGTLNTVWVYRQGTMTILNRTSLAGHA